MGTNLIKLAAVYLVVGLFMGMYMSMAEDHTLKSVHTHINLLGWATLAIMGIIYKLYPQLENTVLANIHFWLHNVGLPVMMISLAFYLSTGNNEFVIGISSGSTLVVIGVVLYVINLFKLKT